LAEIAGRIRMGSPARAVPRCESLPQPMLPIKQRACLYAESLSETGGKAVHACVFA